MNEIWKDVIGFSHHYEVSNLGNVRNKKTNRILKRRIWNRRDKVRLVGGRQKYVHRLVAEAFIPNHGNFPEVNHIDGNPSNNHYNNLEWCTRGHNMQHAHDNKLIVHSKGKDHHKAIFDDAQVLTIRSVRNDGLKVTDIARYYKCRQQTISEICLRHLWRHI